MKILVMTIPHVPGYFNAAYNMSIFQVSAYLKKNFINDLVVSHDVSALNYTWKDIATLLKSEDFDLITILSDYDSIDNLERLMFYISELTPKSKTMVFGRLSMQIPEFFKRFSLDYIAYQGDFERNIESVINHLKTKSIPKGCFYKEEEIYLDGVFSEPLSSDMFEFPDVSEVPYQAYYNLYKDENSRYCGVPNRRELVVHVSRGCPIGCEFCDVQLLQGLKDRRVSAEKVLDYIEMNKDEFEYVTFFSAIFTLNKRWLNEFCKGMIARKINMPWKCVTTIQSLSKCDLKLLKESGCFRIGLGIETLENESVKILPKEKKIELLDIKNLFHKCNELNIEINAFIMVGLENETTKGIEDTINFIEKDGNRARLSLYTPYDILDSDMTTQQIAQFNRQTFNEFSPFNFEKKQTVYDFLYKKKFLKSKVQRYVPEKRSISRF